MNIGIFGGAFNPVHNGHLHLIDNLMVLTPNLRPIDKLILIPTADPPHKPSDELVSGEHRINMLRLAALNPDAYKHDVVSRIEISTIEFESKGKSYTYNTLKRLKKIYPHDDLFLLMGSDQLFSFTQWYRYDGILRLADVMAITREEREQERVRRYLLDHPELRGVNCMAVPPVVVSSSMVRDMVRRGEDISHLVPPGVQEYIKDNDLYV